MQRGASYRKRKPRYSLRDFEKGLMLAGFLTPISVSEIHEKTLLDQQEKQLSNQVIDTDKKPNV